MKRWQSLLISLLALLSAGLAMARAPVTTRKVIIGYYGGTCEAPLYAALHKGFWKEEGLPNVELVPGDQTIFKDALAAHKIDATDGMLASWLKPAEQGLDIYFTAGLHTGCNQILARAGSPINSVKDLKGKTIGVGQMGGSSMIILSRLFTQLHINPQTDVSWKVFPNSELPLALKQGKVDAVGLADPLAQLQIDRGLAKKLLNIATDPPFRDEYCCLTVLSGKVVREEPAVAAAITRGLLRASLWVQTHLEESAQMELDHKYIPGGSVAENVRILKTYNFRPSIAGGYAAVLLAARQCRDAHVLDPSTDPQKLANRVFFRLKDVQEVK
jgi:NitT/TauT family transport system substrate-binding protein